MLRAAAVRSAALFAVVGYTVSVALLAGCQSQRAGSEGDSSAIASSPPAMSSGESKDSAAAPGDSAGWRSLFDGRSTAGWRGYRADSMPSGWRVEDGTLVRAAQAGNIVTVDTFRNFELALDWKVSSGGNSGIMYRVTEDAKEPYETGPEMQVLDDARHADGKNPLTSAGALYGLYAAPPGVVKPAGEWNHARIVLKGNHVEHWLNGQKVVDAELWSPDFTARHAKSKFTQWPPYAKAARGHIALQDHGDWVAYRNVRIRELK